MAIYDIQKGMFLFPKSSYNAKVRKLIGQTTEEDAGIVPLPE